VAGKKAAYTGMHGASCRQHESRKVLLARIRLGVYQATALGKSRHVEAYPAELKIQQLQERVTGINDQQVNAIHPDQFGVSAENTASWAHLSPCPHASSRKWFRQCDKVINDKHDVYLDDMVNPQQNHLLSALPEAAKDRIVPHLKVTKLKLGQVVYEPGDVLRHAYFPTDSIVSLLYVMEDGRTAEISVVGNEGLIGIALFMGGESTPSRAIVQSAGSAYRLDARRLKEEFARHSDLQILLLRYTQSLITQMSQTAVCNRHHTIDQQLCRWLLLSLDRLPDNRLTMTQELIANMLGVRREGVTEAARKLLKANVIDYERGHITVLDRPELERLCCECYRVVKRETDRLLPYVAPATRVTKKSMTIVKKTD
jgi:CRP-like cAMP-binding protein